MKRHILISVTFAFSLICSCSVTKTSAPSSNIVTGGKLWSALWQQRAAEYKALCFQAYNVAKLRVDEALKQPQTTPLAIITDIDETVLDNSPNAVAQALKGKDFDQDAWYKWTSKAACDTVPGSASFFKYAAAKGISVFYITNRDENERDATLNNLKKYQFPFADNEHLMLKKTTSGKEPRRSEVSKSHKIILLIGDNLSDFSLAFDKLQLSEREKVTTENAVLFGDKFIMLPNAGYGDWENSLFRYNYKLNQSQKEQIILDLLKKE